MNRLMGKKVLITAAGQGMGRAAAIANANAIDILHHSELTK